MEQKLIFNIDDAEFDKMVEEMFETLPEEVIESLMKMYEYISNPPEIKTMIAVHDAYDEERIIVFWSDKDVAKYVSKFGDVIPTGNGLTTKRWRLTVDGRYSYEEVKEYIRGLEEVSRYSLE